MKKVWSKPALLSLCRGRPEESVLQLAGCKNEVIGSAGPDHALGGVNCDTNNPPYNDCLRVNT
jgi:hypothetical protein